jgi:hypothetical protein
MSVKLVLMKSLEDVIADVKELVSGEKVIGYQLENPYVVSLNREGDQVGFYPYAPLSKDTSVRIPCDWIVTILEPRDEISKSYEDKVNAKSENSDTKE